MGKIIRFIFKTKFKYNLFDRIMILINLAAIFLWALILINILNQHK